MIIIFSERSDHSTTKVMEYLHHWKQEVIRINKEDTIDADYNVSLSSTGNVSLNFRVNDDQISLDDVSSIWFRRGGFRFRDIEQQNIKKNPAVICKQVVEYLSSEQITLNTFIYEAMLARRIRVLGNPFVSSTKKMSVLRIATECGLEVPETIVTTRKSTVEKFLSVHTKLITKAIQDNFTPYDGEHPYELLTEIMDETRISTLSSKFFPSLFQKRIDKKYDIRTFFLNNEFYTIAICSQDNIRTEVDFRNYDKLKPNRIIIIKLPVEIEEKLYKLLAILQLNTASIDLILSNENRFVFLEVNPSGQYDMLNAFTNFQLDKKIAAWLMNR